MTAERKTAEAGHSRIVAGFDTCGPEGSVTLARLEGGAVEILGQTELAGRNYSATLIAALEELLSQAGIPKAQLDAIVVVNGPGSFTGVRVGVSSAKGLAEGLGVPLVAVSRLEVLAAKAGSGSAALDAHRHEVFLRLGLTGSECRELLAGPEELAEIDPVPERVAVCDDAAAGELKSAWPGVQIERVEAPTASDAILLCAEQILAGDFVDTALLDGHYLRRSDAEIFSAPGAREKRI